MNNTTRNALGFIAAGLFLPAVFAASLAMAAEGSGTVTTSEGTVTYPTIFPGSGTATSK